MMPFTKCPVCSGDIMEKQVEEIIYSGNNALIINVPAEVCLKCGERLYSPEVIQKMESIKAKLEKNEIEGFKKIGQFYKAA
jgi:YgiT-type zinc finger domain-containing protein